MADDLHAAINEALSSSSGGPSSPLTSLPADIAAILDFVDVPVPAPASADGVQKNESEPAQPMRDDTESDSDIEEVEKTLIVEGKEDSDDDEPLDFGRSARHGSPDTLLLIYIYLSSTIQFQLSASSGDFWS